MILLVAMGLSIVALPLLIVWPVAGIALLFISRPLIDTTFGQPVLYSFHLTEIVSVAVPIVVGIRLLMAGSKESLSRMPLKRIWIIYVAYIAMFSLVIAFNKDFLQGADVFFRYVNGFIGFYMLQAFVHDDRGKQFRVLLLAMMTAGLFPMGIGLYQLLTGKVWITAQVEGINRYVGLYHDAYTVRYYAFQTIMALLLYGSLFSRNVVARLGLLVYGVVSTAVMIGAYSKSGIVTLAMWGATWTLLRKKMTTFIVLVACVGVVGVYYSSDIADNIAQLFHKEIGAFEGKVHLEQTFQGRWYSWEKMLGQWKKFDSLKQTFGSGEVAIGAHNDFLQILFHGGMVGLLLYLVLLSSIGLAIIGNLRRKSDPMGVAALMLLLMWLVDSIGLVPSAYPGYQWFVWGLIGLSLRLHEDKARAAAQPVPVVRSPLPASGFVVSRPVEAGSRLGGQLTGKAIS